MNNAAMLHILRQQHAYFRKPGPAWRGSEVERIHHRKQVARTYSYLRKLSRS
jgi:hypothetical protein